ncbi:D-alanyl-D-alanine dipeptidase [Paenibacillus sp. yr247]|uniref:M15 family metallopeptidase n=1 Tax=Paenibacillus sp. yr247 TaxID=1761880 RepID=UPI00088F8172|nr:M15 family metallopeptidase [Paenibacillus sp. yr247]SDP29460.1 D-alanyl-D-alanine dipeptidase [Paenibacillus sp. yr247]
MKPIANVISPKVNYRSLPILECGEPLVSLSNLSSKIKVHPFYHETNIPGALIDCYLREGATAKLIEAAALLPEDCFFVVLDGFRPYEVQLELYHMIKQDIQNRGEVHSEEELAKEIAKFVAYPSPDVETPSPHMTGGAVDLTVAKEDGWLDMGTDFDYFSDKALTAWYELNPMPTDQELNIRNNRRMLYHAMTSVGFANYENEWWHYDFGNQRWAMQTGQVAFYKGKSALS